MAEIIKMPKMSDTMEEGVIAVWHKKVGDEIKSGDLVAEIETDKATMDYESYNDGTLLYLGAGEGDSIKVNDILAIVGKKGEDYKDLLKEAKSGSGEKEAGKEEKKEDKKEDKKEAAEEETVDASDVNAEIVLMPKMSDTMTEGVIAAWHKKVGDEVKSGDLLAEIETDKATMEYESYHDGVLLYVGPGEGESVEVDGILAIIGEKGADYEKLIKAHKASGIKDNGQDTEDPKPESKKQEPKQESEKQESSSDDDGDRIKASPLAKKMAEDLGYDISKIKGTGDHGRIIKRDVEEYEPSKEAATDKKQESRETAFEIPAVVGEEKYEEVKVSQMRKTIAKRLAESKFTAPHFYLTMEINMDKAMDARKSINELSPIKISFNDIVIKAVAGALRQHPDVNVSWRGDTIRKNKHIHIGVAVAVPEGLLVPVVRFADNKSLSHIAAEVKELAGKAQNKELQPSDWEGSTFTISNLGMFGIEEFTAIINPPDACILAVGGIKETAIVKDGQLVPGNVMKVTMSCDHRAVDGAVGAAFLKTLKGLLEDPVRILI